MNQPNEDSSIYNYKNETVAASGRDIGSAAMPRDQQVAYQLDLMVDGIEGSGVYVRSKDVPGLHLVGPSLKQMKPAVEKALKRLFRDNRGVDVNVIWVAEIRDFQHVADLPNRVAIYQRAAA